MMSSFDSTISKNRIKITDKPKVISENRMIEKEQFQTVYLKEHEQSLKRRVSDLEKQMFQELKEKQEAFLQKGYEEGRRNAVAEAEENVKKELQDIMQQANSILDEANQYRKKIMEEAEQRKYEAQQEAKEQLLELMFAITERLIQQELKAENINVEAIYMEAIKKINYDTKKIYVRVHPYFKERLEKSPYYRVDSRFEYFYDLNIQIGDVFIETDKEYIDASIKQKINELKKQMRSELDDSI